MKSQKHGLLTLPNLFASMGLVLNAMNDSKKTQGETVNGEVIEALLDSA